MTGTGLFWPCCGSAWDPQPIATAPAVATNATQCVMRRLTCDLIRFGIDARKESLQGPRVPAFMVDHSVSMENDICPTPHRSHRAPWTRSAGASQCDGQEEAVLSWRRAGRSTPA